MCRAEPPEPFTYAPPHARSQERLCSGGRSRGRPRWSKGPSGGSSEQGPQGFVSTWGLCHFVAYVTFGKSPCLGAPPCAPLWKGHFLQAPGSLGDRAGAKRGGALHFTWALWEKGLRRVERPGMGTGALSLWRAGWWPVPATLCCGLWYGESHSGFPGDS